VVEARVLQHRHDKGFDAQLGELGVGRHQHHRRGLDLVDVVADRVFQQGRGADLHTLLDRDVAHV
jgi:hypothetical protein